MTSQYRLTYTAGIGTGLCVLKANAGIPGDKSIANSVG